MSFTGIAAAQSFAPAVNYNVGSGPEAVTVGDLNRDGRPDLAVANSGSGNVSVLLGNGDGTFQASVDYPTNPAPTEFAVGNFNGDGLPDLVVANLTPD